MEPAGGAAAFVLFIFLFILFISLILGSFAFWIWMLIDCATNEPDEGNTKVVWILIIIFTQVIGALIYFFVRRPERLGSK